MKNKKQTITREDNTINIYNINHPRCVSEFIKAIKTALDQKYEEIIIKSQAQNSPKWAVFPNACAPISAILDYYRNKGVSFNFELDKGEYLSSCNFQSPQFLSPDDIKKMDTPFDKILKYNSPKQVAEYTQKCINTISQKTECEKGVIDSLIWCINEVMDNVLVHGNCEYGYVMAQFHERTKHIALCIADNGIGIYNSLKSTKHSVKSSKDAITLAIQEGIGDGQGQGNGLFGLYEIVRANKGSLSITSGDASLILTFSGDIKTFDSIPILSSENRGTNIDFQMDLSREVALSSVLSSIGGFDAFDIRIDNDMIDDADRLVYDVYENCQGTATRPAGELIRNDVTNIIKRRQTPMILDFSKVATVSSSFIDEFIAKMIISFGISKFFEIISIRGMNDTIRHLYERAIYMRIKETWDESR